jgi:hypothetical protein
MQELVLLHKIANPQPHAKSAKNSPIFLGSIEQGMQLGFEFQPDSDRGNYPKDQKRVSAYSGLTELGEIPLWVSQQGILCEQRLKYSDLTESTSRSARQHRISTR